MRLKIRLNTVALRVVSEKSEGHLFAPLLNMLLLFEHELKSRNIELYLGKARTRENLHFIKLLKVAFVCLKQVHSS